MKSTTAIFDEAASRSDRHPLFVLTFASTHIELCSWEFGGACSDRWPLIAEVGGYTGTVKPDEGRSDVSGVTIKIIDDERMHQLAAMLPDNDRIVIRGGFRSIESVEADWPVLLSGLLDEFKLDTSLGMWSMSVNDLNYYRVNSAFRTFGKTRADGAILAGDAVIDVDSTDGSSGGDQAFHDPGDSETNGWLLIDNREICSYTGVNATQFTGVARGQLAQCGGRPAMAHDDNVEIRELFVLQDNPIDLILKILTSTGTGANGAYDAWESDQGLGIDVDLIDLDAFETERDRYLPSDEYRFVLKEPVKSVKNWTESEILKTLNAYLIITGAGLISMRLYNPPFAEEPEALEESDMSNLSGWDRGLSELKNHTQFSYDWNVIDGEFMTHRYDLEGDSITEHGLSKPWKCQCKGMYTDTQAGSIITRRVARLFLRYAQGAPGFDCDLDFEKFKHDPGDIVAVTHARLPDLARGVRGVVSQLMELVSVRPEWMKGKVRAKVLDTRLSGKFGMICPNDYPAYDAATLEQRQWAYICDTATELMPNGDPPTLII